MNKSEFLTQLRGALKQLPQYEIDQSSAFYAEMIDDRVEDGIPEEEAVASLGDINAIAAQIIAETPIVPKTIAKAKTGSRTLNIVLLIVLSPFWVPIALAFFFAALSIYLAIWMVIFSLWLAVLCFIVAGILCLIATIPLLIWAYPATALLSAGFGFVSIGIGLFSFFGVWAASKGLFNLTKTFASWVRSLFIRRGSVQ